MKTVADVHGETSFFQTDDGKIFTKLAEWPDPTPEMLASSEFEAIWQVIKSWDVNVPDVYSGYMGATGNHVRAILDALMPSLGQLTPR